MQKILVANRGEIALRVMRTAREMGIKTVAVFSEADRNMPFVRFADEAVCIGPAPSAQSYLRADKIIEVAKQTGADAIHPGYGFLSENAGFSKAVSDAGLIFIGPSAYSIDMMGSKISAKQAAKKFNVPMVPGTENPIESVAEAKEIASKAGYPVLIKASAGGGGKGMRVVNKEEELESQMQMAKSEALSSFGDDAVFIEKYVASPRHIEIQLMGDQHGNYVYLFERECSIQRRHQKLIEEAPSSCLTPDIRKAMGESAVAVARSCKYHGAGTVEFLVDEALNFYFLEMNTRLQVEHPVTEMVMGMDLVKLQIRVAEGHPLPFRQEDLRPRGHAIECRINAEDVFNNFVPSTGKISYLKLPEGPGVRVDSGVGLHSEISRFYDPIAAKLVVWAETRPEAIARMKRALGELRIEGIDTTAPFCLRVLDHPEFQQGNFNINFVDRYWQQMQQSLPDEAEAAEIIAAAIAYYRDHQSAPTLSPSENVNHAPALSPWKTRALKTMR